MIIKLVESVGLVIDTPFTFRDVTAAFSDLREVSSLIVCQVFLESPVYWLKLFARHEFANLSFETLPDTLRNKTQRQTGKTSEQRLASHQQNDGRLQKFADSEILC